MTFFLTATAAIIDIQADNWRFFRRGLATLEPAVSVGMSVGLSVGNQNNMQAFFLIRPCFSCVHTTLQPALSVGPSICPSHFAFSAFAGSFGVTTPAQLLG